MKIPLKKRKRLEPTEWHWKFALWPTRTSSTHITWLGWYQRRMKVLSEGNWAGGFCYRWHYANTGGLWESPVHCS